MLMEWIGAAFLIFAAEMGDKTQILAMMFATKYKVRQVLFGVFIGSLLNHGLAVAFGSVIGRLVPTYIMQMIAGAAFLIFAMMSLMGDEEDEEEEKKSGFKAPVLIVAMAFFIGELGDKTQLAAITLSVDATYPLMILLGTVTGMILTSALGIFVGTKIGDRLPESLIKVVSSCIFLIFGLQKLVVAVPSHWITWWSLTLFVCVIGLAFTYLIKVAYRSHKAGELTPYSRAAANLYRYGHNLQEIVDNLCMGVNHCGKCQKERCAVGFIKHLLADIRQRDYDHQDHQLLMNAIGYQRNKFSKERMLETLSMTIAYMRGLGQEEEGYREANMIRMILEQLLLEESLTFEGNVPAYKKLLEARGYYLK